MASPEKIWNHRRYCSDLYEIKDMACDFSRDRDHLNGYNDCFCILLMNRGEMLFDIGRSQSFELHTGHLLIDKPGYEFRMRPAIGACTVINFSEAFYNRIREELPEAAAGFLSDPDVLSCFMKSGPDLEYLHRRLVQQCGNDQLETDLLMIELVNIAIRNTTKFYRKYVKSDQFRSFHLPSIEAAKTYIHLHFDNDFSLFDLAAAACVSPFHFSRLFKQYCGVSPHRYVREVRLKHAEILLRTGARPVVDIAFDSGFSNAEYFSTAFKSRYGSAPGAYRIALQGQERYRRWI